MRGSNRWRPSYGLVGRTRSLAPNRAAYAPWTHRLQQVNLGRPQIALVKANVFAPVEVETAEYGGAKISNRMPLARGDDEVFRLVLLQHEPHGFDVVAGEAPVALGVEIAEIQAFLQSLLDSRGRAGDLSGDESLASPRALVVEQDPLDAYSR